MRVLQGMRQLRKMGLSVRDVAKITKEAGIDLTGIQVDADLRADRAVDVAMAVLSAKPELPKDPSFDFDSLIELIIALLPLIELIIALFL